MNNDFGHEAQARIQQLHHQYQDEFGRLQQHYRAKVEENAQNIRDYNQLLQEHKALADLSKSIDFFTGEKLENAHDDGVLKEQRA